MKKLILPFVALTMLFASSNSNAQVVEQGSVIVDGYYGFPNLYTAIFKGIYADIGEGIDIKFGSLGPLGLRGEYLLTDKVGLGMDLGMNSSSITYTETSTSSTGVITSYDYKFATQKIGAMVTFNYHFIENDNLDAYFVIGMGYGKRTFTTSTTNPNYTDDNATLRGLIPVASKIGVGMRYFFTENLGANLALGFGQGGLLNVGISAKF